MRALDPEVVNAVWAAVEALIPERVNNHPLGCHRRRIPDRVCFEGILIRLATGCSWEDAERLSRTAVSDTTLRERRDEWIAAGVFDALADEALAAYDRVVGVDLSEAAVDGSTHKAPCGARAPGPTPPTGGNWAGSGRHSPTATASPWAGPRKGRTATT
jgi:transposase